MTRASRPARCAHWGLGGSRSLGLRYGPKFGRRCALFLIIVESRDEHVSSEDRREQALHVLASGAPTDLLPTSYDLYQGSLSRSRRSPSVQRSPDRLARASEGRRVGRSGRTRASRGDTRTCFFKHLSLTRGEHVAWEDPRPRGTRLVAPRPPAFSLRAPPVVKQEVSAHPHRYGRSAKSVSSGVLRGLVRAPHTSAYFRPSSPWRSPVRGEAGRRRVVVRGNAAAHRPMGISCGDAAP